LENTLHVVMEEKIQAACEEVWYNF
jgi:hypothetical protein